MDIKDFFKTYNMVTPPDIVKDEIVKEKTYENPLEKLMKFSKPRINDEIINQSIEEETPVTESISYVTPSINIGTNTNLTFEQMLKKTGLDKYIKITSGFRDPSRHVGKYWRTSNHGKRDENGESYAYDIVPINGDFVDMKRRLQNNKEMHNYLLAKGYRVLDETSKAMQRKTGAIGAHFHLSHKPGSKEGISYASFMGIKNPIITSNKLGGTINSINYVLDNTFLSKVYKAQEGTKLNFVNYTQYQNYPTEISNIPEFNYIIPYNDEIIQEKLSEKDEILMDEVLNEVLANEEKNAKTYTKDYTVYKDMKFNTKRDFIKIMAPIIKKELDKIGATSHLFNVLAQIALESGWGKHQSGKNNFAGLKATASQKGTILNTHEVENGIRIAKKSKFMDFDSINDFANYYINRLNKKFHAFDGGDYTANIKRNGYFTSNENQYRNNLNNIKQSIQNLV